jgi:hypothetical protein
VVDASGVPVGRISVGREMLCLVGGRVEVTKIALVETGVSSATLMQEPRLRLATRSKLQIFFMQRILLCKD